MCYITNTLANMDAVTATSSNATQIQTVQSIRREQLNAKDGYADLHFSVSVDCIPNHSCYNASFTYALMRRLLYSARTFHVSFTCDKTVTRNDHNRWHSRTSQKKHPPGGAADADAVGNPNDILEQSAFDESDNATVSAEEKYFGHKIVLSQWPYFKEMFSKDLT